MTQTEQNPLQGSLIQPQREVATPAQASFVGRPVRDPVAGARYAMAAGGVVLERHGRNLPSQAGPRIYAPTSTQAEILDLLKRLQQSRGMALLLITHDMGVVAEVADDVAVMRYGRAVEHETVGRIFHALLHPYTRRLLSATRRLEATAAPAVRATPEPSFP